VFIVISFFSHFSTMLMMDKTFIAIMYVVTVEL